MSLKESESDAIARLFEALPEIPAMPRPIARVLEVVQRHGVSLSEVADALEQEPALCAKVLRVSNSAYFGMKRQVSTIKLAVVVLGLREIRDIAMGIALFDAVCKPDVETQTASDIWNHALAVGAVARRLGNIVDPGFQDGAFIAGLLSDIGRMLMLTVLGQQYVKVYREHHRKPLDLVVAERDVFGYSHAALARALTDRWNLPHTIVDVVGAQYRMDGISLRTCRNPELAAVVRAAKSAVDDDFERPMLDDTALGDDELWEVLDQTRYPIAPENRMELLQDLANTARNLPRISLF